MFLIVFVPTETSLCNMEQCFEFCSELLLCHSVRVCVNSSIFNLYRLQCPFKCICNVSLVLFWLVMSLFLCPLQRPPFSINLFNSAEVTQILKYIHSTYIRHYNLYKYIFTPQVWPYIKDWSSGAASLFLTHSDLRLVLQIVSVGVETLYVQNFSVFKFKNVKSNPKLKLVDLLLLNTTQCNMIRKEQIYRFKIGGVAGRAGRLIKINQNRIFF